MGIALPKVLKPLFQVQNGGAVQYSDIRILPLDQVAPAESEFWTDAEYSRKLIPDTSLVFRFAADRRRGDHHFFLNFNANGRDGEASVYHLYHDPGELSLVAKTVKVLFDKLIGVTDSPLADWSHHITVEATSLERLEKLQRTLFGS
ncbi:MAG: SMI1/KNR4 family protein [Planctomycetota bacterium]